VNDKTETRIPISNEIVNDKTETRIPIPTGIVNDKTETRIPISNEIVNDKTETRIPIPTGIVNDKTETRIPISNEIVNDKTETRIPISNEIVNDKKFVYHLNLNQMKIKRAHYALLTGDPERVSDIALVFDPQAKEIAYRREYRTFLGEMNACPVLVVSTGIGGPSTSIAIDELAQIGIHTFIRVGTTGAIQPNINVGDVIITSGAVRLDGASTHYAPIEYPAVSHHEVLFALIKAAQNLNSRYYIGITASSDTFYPGQERYNSYSRYILRRFQGTTEELKKLQVLNYEMECSTVLTLCSCMGLRGGCVTGVIVNRTKDENIKVKDFKISELNAIKIAIEAVHYLISEKD